MTWNEELWPLVIQAYLKKPYGMKPLYSREVVNLALELHIPPQVLHSKMAMLRKAPTPTLSRMMDIFQKKPQWLRKACQQLRHAQGMGSGGAFFEDVEIVETFEKDFRPVNAKTAQLTGRPLFSPVMLIMILDLYFRLVPATMVKETPEVKELSSLLDISAKDIVDILEIYQYCDPFIDNDDSLMDPMLPPCYEIWQRFAEEDLDKLSSLAQQLKEYF